MLTVAAAVAAGAAYLVALAALLWTLAHVPLWWRHRRPELYAKGSGTAFALALAVAALALPPLIVWTLVDGPAGFAFVAAAAAAATGYAWFQLRVSYELPLAEVRYWLAQRRLARLVAAATGGAPPRFGSVDDAALAARRALSAGGGDAVLDALARVRRTESSFRATRDYHRDH